jgi:S-adenosylmethionine-diacylgycerolhomoserine-N-methlytransferase
MSDLPVIWRMLRGMPRAGDHAARLEGFYAGQAEAYDGFRERLLHGRDEAVAALELRPGQVLVELGAGTGRNLERAGAAVASLASAHLVDLCPSLLAVARRRIARHGWDNVEAVAADATAWRPPRPADAVLCAYSLTMMPDWRAVLANALAMLRPGGRLVVVDFTVVDRHLAGLAGASAQSRPVRAGWRAWFGHDGVRPDAAMFPGIASRLREPRLTVGYGRVPWLPLRMAWALCAGRI